MWRKCVTCTWNLRLVIANSLVMTIQIHGDNSDNYWWLNYCNWMSNQLLLKLEANINFVLFTSFYFYVQIENKALFKTPGKTNTPPHVLFYSSKTIFDLQLITFKQIWKVNTNFICTTSCRKSKGRWMKRLGFNKSQNPYYN